MKRLWLLLLLAGCVHRVENTGPDDGRFKMLHQVSVTYGGSQYLLQGYVLGKPNGDFRVSAAAMMGPRIFDVARIGGEWKSKIHFAQLKDKLDPKYLGHAIDRVYFVECPDKAASCPVVGDEEFDSVTIERNPAGEVVSKHFLTKGTSALEILYTEYGEFSGVHQAGKITVTHVQYQLIIALESYQPHPGFADELLEP